MAHELEMINGQASMAYVGDVPWHGLGTAVPADLTPMQMLEAAKLDWTVEKHPLHCVIDDNVVTTDRHALVRSTDRSIIDIVTTDWNPIQNQEAFEFFNDFVAAGDMEMHTAGSLQGGKIVWGMARIKESFELFKGDVVDLNLLFTNYHKYGHSTDTRITPTRVVCKNTLSLAMGERAQHMVKISHRKKFDPDGVKIVLGVAKDKLSKYKDMAEFLGSKKAKEEDIVQYFKRIFPTLSKESDKMSKNAEAAMEVLHTQPGAQYAEGSWSPFNAVTYMVDHTIGRSADRRLTSAWYGQGARLKNTALEMAVEYADAA